MDPMSPDGPPDRNITIRLTRESVVLASALLFLGVAILLAVLFPPGSSSTSATRPTPDRSTTTVASGATGVAQATSAGGVANIGTTPGVFGTRPPDTATSLPEPTVAAQNPNGYPAPQTTTISGQAAPTLDASQALGTPGASQAGTPVPTFNVTRPTTAAGYPAPGQNGATAVSTEDPLFAPQTPPPAQNQPQPTQNQSQSSPTPEPPQPTPEPLPTNAVPRPTEGAGGADESTPVATRTPRPTPAPTAIPIIVLKGDVRWTAAQSPIILRRDVQLTAGSTLVIEPGVEVRLAPGVAFYTQGDIFALGQPGRPVRFVNLEGQRWDGLFAQSGSTVDLTNVEMRGGGNGGTVLVSEGGTLILKGARITDNGGHIQVNNSRLEVRDTEIAGNDMPYGAALDVTYGVGGGSVNIINSRIGGNRLSGGAPPVQIASSSPIDTVNMQIDGNLLVGQDGPNLVLSTRGQLRGDITCNALLNGTNGLSIRSETLQVPGLGLNIRNNAIEDHTPPIIPIYLELGIGRGATSEVALDMRDNWWKSDTGPYEPDRHADGRGEAVGENIEFAPWLTSRPSCAPQP